MVQQVLLKQLFLSQNASGLSQVILAHLRVFFEPTAAAVHVISSAATQASISFCDGEALTEDEYPTSFWSWVSQFATVDGLVSFKSSPCQWAGSMRPAQDYVFVLDDHPAHRVYLTIHGVSDEKARTLLSDAGSSDFMLMATRWQCVRAEHQAAQERRARETNEIRFRDEHTQRDAFIDGMKRIQEIAVELSAINNLDEMHRLIVESVREKLGFDRSAFFLLDMKKRCFMGTYGTDEEGNTISEHRYQYDLHQLEPRYIEAITDPEQTLVVLDSVPLYTAGTLVGHGWNGMLLLRDGKDVFGWLAVDNMVSRRDAMEGYQEQILTSLGSLLAQIYIRKHQEQNVRLLHASMMELSRCQSMSDVCKTAVNFAITRLDIDRMGIFLTDEHCSYLQGTWGTDIHGNVVDESDFHEPISEREAALLASENPNEMMFQESAPIYHENRMVGFGWTAMVMLADKGVPIAFLAADNLIRRSPLSTQLREVLRMFASNLTEVIMRARAQQATQILNENLERLVAQRTQALEQANEKLDQLIKMDPLTRLGNRRMLEHILEEICHQESDQIIVFGVILLDIDHFGLYNNHYGHLEGDIALMRLGSLLRRHTQGEHEQFCRIGGEEFALLVTHYSPQAVHDLAEQIRASVEAENIAHATNPQGSCLTVSIGYSTAQYKPRDLAFDTLYSLADRAMYEAKRQGRNRVMFCDAQSCVCS